MSVAMSQGPQPRDLARQILEHRAPKYDFSFSPFLLKTYRFGLNPNRPVCKAFIQGHCPLGNDCPDKHTSTNNFNNLVCKHWLRGLCKKGETCEFLHEYNLRKMPECNFFVRNGYCSNGDECLYLHVDPQSKLPPCPHYEKGFCPLGPRCAKKHVRKQICRFYLAGFCPDGKNCKEGTHPKWPADLEPPKARAERDVEEFAEDQARSRDTGEREEEKERERFGGARGSRWSGKGRQGGQEGRRGRGRGHF